MTKDLTRLDDDALEAEHQSRTEAVQQAKDAYAKHHDDKHGKALLAAREAASETQQQLNERHGAPPAQAIGT